MKGEVFGVALGGCIWVYGRRGIRIGGVGRALDTEVECEGEGGVEDFEGVFF